MTPRPPRPRYGYRPQSDPDGWEPVVIYCDIYTLVTDE